MFSQNLLNFNFRLVLIYIGSEENARTKSDIIFNSRRMYLSQGVTIPALINPIPACVNFSFSNFLAAVSFFHSFNLIYLPN
jgi:hypothetical protein